MNVAIYTRVPTLRQAENGLSLPDHQPQLEAWCKEQGHTIVATYIDAGKSAKDGGKRPEFNRMMEAALTSPPPFDAIVVHSLSRFSRDQTELMWHVKQMRRNGVALCSVTQVTSDIVIGEMITRIIAMFDNYSRIEEGSI
jgi:DNA invertase Pin-like site-specific DNA recombinase